MANWNWTTKYETDQMVYVLGRAAARRDVNCAACGNTGKVTINAVEYECPGCRGRGKQVASIDAWYVHDDGPVGRVQITKVSPSARMAGDDEDLTVHVTYILRGQSGSVYREQDVFGSRHEADAEVVRRNADAAECFERADNRARR